MDRNKFEDAKWIDKMIQLEKEKKRKVNYST